MPSINKDTQLSIKRREFIKICGNISKHNFSRLGGVGLELSRFSPEMSVPIDIHGALLALYDFYEHFHVNILNYHGSTIAEFLNNIIWGIREYLQPEFSRSIVYMGGHPLEYKYTYPEGIVNEFREDMLLGSDEYGPKCAYCKEICSHTTVEIQVLSRVETGECYKEESEGKKRHRETI